MEKSECFGYRETDGKEGKRVDIMRMKGKL